MIEKYGIFEIQDVDDIGLGQDCLVKLDEISVTELNKLEGKNEQEKLKTFIKDSIHISINTACRILKYYEYNWEV